MTWLYVDVGMDWVQITPFREVDMGGPNVAALRRFNHLHAKMLVEVENAIGRWKGRWHALRMIYAHPDLAAHVQEVCVALHNFLEEREAPYDARQEEHEDVTMPTSAAADGNNTSTSLGVLRRIEIVNALGHLWVAYDSHWYACAYIILTLRHNACQLVGTRLQSSRPGFVPNR